LALNEKIADVRQKMMDAGAHFVIDTMAELPGIIEHINCILSKHEKIFSAAPLQETLTE
jgi:hypothetical protein